MAATEQMQSQIRHAAEVSEQQALQLSAQRLETDDLKQV